MKRIEWRADLIYKPELKSGRNPYMFIMKHSFLRILFYDLLNNFITVNCPSLFPSFLVGVCGSILQTLTLAISDQNIENLVPLLVSRIYTRFCKIQTIFRLPDKNRSNLYPFSHQNGSKTIPFSAAHSYLFCPLYRKVPSLLG